MMSTSRRSAAETPFAAAPELALRTSSLRIMRCRLGIVPPVCNDTIGVELLVLRPIYGGCSVLSPGDKFKSLATHCVRLGYVALTIQRHGHAGIPKPDEMITVA